MPHYIDVDIGGSKIAAALVAYPTLKTTPILISKLKDDAPLLGAAALFKIKRWPDFSRRPKPTKVG